MRDSLKDAIKRTIMHEYSLPCPDRQLSKSCISSCEDVCLTHSSDSDVAKIIYNGIVEFAVNEYKIDYKSIEIEQLKVIIARLRYDFEASEDTKIRYGFYGEVLLDLILRVFFKTSVLVARGYFYSPIENAEPKGFDAFHLMERDGGADLWFGEAKFYTNYKQAITSVVEKINTSLGERYINKNLLAIITQRENVSTHNQQIENLLDAWENNPKINFAQEMKTRMIRLVYPIFIAYEKRACINYDQSIKECIEHISNETNRLNIRSPFGCSIFFIFLPLTEVKIIKQTVIQWIDLQAPLI